MLHLDADLPLAVLVDQAGPALARAMAGAGASWFEAVPGLVETCEGAASLWQPRQGLRPARPAQPNRGHARLDPQGLRLETGVNCGFALEEATPRAACLSFAALYVPQGDIRTLVTVNLRQAKNYLFLTEQEGLLALRDQGGTAELQTAAAPGPKLVLAGLSEGRLFLRQGAGPVLSAEVPRLAFEGPADLFIGCRSHREGLVKTFGSGWLRSVLFWPGLNLLDGSPAAAAQLAALDAWRFWDG